MPSCSRTTPPGWTAAAFARISAVEMPDQSRESTLHSTSVMPSCRAVEAMSAFVAP
ncbi:hypothetical protein ACFQV2_33995 [Actinokineospora soli]|uniref:Uncharacterized protein n=1 Tax=Actinokineospora soli TaxID=1048753 RepID=A0ABW2TUY0_9PSEU